MDTIKLIHNDFDTAVETLVRISEEKEKNAESLNEPTPEKDYEDGIFLSKLGFLNIDLVKKVSEFETDKRTISHQKTVFINESKIIKDVVTFYQKTFPFYKFILYSQVINICEKYNLYLGHSSLYKGNIPKKNIEEMKNFPFNVYNSSSFERYIPYLHHMPNEPLCNCDLNHYANQYGYNGNGNNSSINTYICAPLNSFDEINIKTVGKELYRKSSDEVSLNPFKFKFVKPAPKDPIILLPVRVEELKQLGFIIMTKWGVEANDESLIVPENN
jgi:hypothetical protein